MSKEKLGTTLTQPPKCNTHGVWMYWNTAQNYWVCSVCEQPQGEPSRTNDVLFLCNDCSTKFTDEYSVHSHSVETGHSFVKGEPSRCPTCGSREKWLKHSPAPHSLGSYTQCRDPWHDAQPEGGEKLLEYSWTVETMQIINRLTPDIKGKAFDPDWFLLRQRFEELEEKCSKLLANRPHSDGIGGACAGCEDCQPISPTAQPSAGTVSAENYRAMAQSEFDLRRENAQLRQERDALDKAAVREAVRECIKIVEQFQHFSDGREDQAKRYIARAIRKRFELE